MADPFLPPAPAEFQRFTAPDADALEADIAATRDRLAAALQAGPPSRVVDCAGDLGSMLTTARREGEAFRVLHEHRGQAESIPPEECVGWYWNAYATALQYLGRRDEACLIFAKALAVSEAGDWARLRSFILQHQGRCQVEQGRLADARESFSEALRLRQQLNDPRQASTQRALDALARLSPASGPAKGDA